MPAPRLLGTRASQSTRHQGLEDGALVEVGAEKTLNPEIATLLAFVFADLGIPRFLLVIGHQIAASSAKVTSRQPDLVVHTPESRAAARDDGKLLRMGLPAPMLVVEIAANSNQDKRSRERAYVDKRAEYAECQIPEYWIVEHPLMRVVLVLTLVDGEYEEERFVGEGAIVSPAFPGLALTSVQVLTAEG